jgi:hypothetical protein
VLPHPLHQHLRTGPAVRRPKGSAVTKRGKIPNTLLHSPWRRGSNENTSGLLRQYFPKGTDLSVHSPERLLEVATELNARPRKTLGGITSAKAMQRLLFDPEGPHRCDDRMNFADPSPDKTHTHVG